MPCHSVIWYCFRELHVCLGQGPVQLLLKDSEYGIIGLGSLRLACRDAIQGSSSTDDVQSCHLACMQVEPRGYIYK